MWSYQDHCEKCKQPFFWNLKDMWDKKLLGTRRHHCRYVDCFIALCSRLTRTAALCVLSIKRCRIFQFFDLKKAVILSCQVIKTYTMSTKLIYSSQLYDYSCRASCAFDVEHFELWLSFLYCSLFYVLIRTGIKFPTRPRRKNS